MIALVRFPHVHLHLHVHIDVDVNVLTAEVIALSLAAAACFAVASVLQHLAANEAPRHETLHPGLLTYLVSRPLWLFGGICDLTGFVLQAIALGRGSLMVVQLLLVSGLLFALPLGAAVTHRRLGRAEWAGALAVAGGLALFLAVGTPTGGRGFAPWREWIVVGGVLGILVGVACALAQRSRGTRRVTLIAGAAGATIGLSAALTRSAVLLLQAGGLWFMLRQWEVYALAGVGMISLLLVQNAFQAGPLAASLPALTVVDPLVSTAIALVLFKEQLAVGGGAVALEVLALVGMTWGIILLARSPIVTGSREGTPRPRAPAPAGGSGPGATHREA